MNPFDGPPASPPVTIDQPPTSPSPPPDAPPEPPSRRGRMVVAIFAVAGLLGAAAFGVGELVSAGDDDADDSAEPADDSTDDADDSSDDADEPTPADADDESATRGDDEPDAPGNRSEGELRIEVGDGEPIIIDLDDLDPGAIGDLAECLGLPAIGDGLPGLDPETLERDLGGLFDGFDPEQFDGEFGDLFEEFFGDGGLGELFEDFGQFEGLDPDQFEDLDPERFDEELGPMLEGFDLDELFGQLLDGFEPGDLDELLEQFEDLFGDLGPSFGEPGGHGASVFEPRHGPSAVGPLGAVLGDLDRQQVDECLAEID